ncbi:right-handed parallel beta-helix repeat-containing protein [Cellulomonas aerilata]|uniref:Uncharacterized protein n=1 Tax=Cellulomonas aerilata TaxID=515326 RepID=A0A512DEN4_9CELL|nr:right-handed parallel beta-helix repeat-containing protein [Cellulomonas aerilata]GEO34944.1 hypothetical protein CAE01nite_26690 [Cellulomonas aerilata]
MTAATTRRGRVRPGHALGRRGAVLGVLAALTVASAGCTTTADPGTQPAAEAAGATALPPLPTEPGQPGGAPLIDAEAPGRVVPEAPGRVVPGASGSSTEAGDRDQDRNQKDEDEEDEKVDDDEPGMTAPTAFPAWMARPAGDRGLCPAPTVRVRTAEQLQKALDDAGPGTVIRMEPGVYQGSFVVTGSGAAGDEAVLCGDADAILNGDGYRGDYVLHLDGAQHWVLSGFTVRNGQKGVMADGTTGTTISGLTVYGIGDEAIHLRRHSTDNLVADNTISDTGLRKPKFGEGVYVGSANSNWGDLTDGEPDRSDRNHVTGNAIYATTSESVDIKEGTTGGVLAGNQFDGSLITGADSWVDVKGNDWTVADNVGRHSPLDGFQTHDVADGWGTRNTFTANRGELRSGEGFLIALRPENENVARCDNALLTDVGGLSNKDCR